MAPLSVANNQYPAPMIAQPPALCVAPYIISQTFVRVLPGVCERRRSPQEGLYGRVGARGCPFRPYSTTSTELSFVAQRTLAERPVWCQRPD